MGRNVYAFTCIPSVVVLWVLCSFINEVDAKSPSDGKNNITVGIMST
jgi:hypothetical protein